MTNPSTFPKATQAKRLGLGTALLLVLVIALRLFTGGEAPATPASRPTAPAPAPTVAKPAGMTSVQLASLPKEAQSTVHTIEKGGPFPFAKDGTEFQNREARLPRKSRGHYREYTVITPGSKDRGARRIVAGADGERYYTDDHYESFRWIVVK